MPEPTKCGACPSWEKQDNQDPASGLCRQMPIKGTFMMMFADDSCLKKEFIEPTKGEEK